MRGFLILALTGCTLKDATFPAETGDTYAPAAHADQEAAYERAFRKGTEAEQTHELGDVFAWLVSLAGQLGISLEDAAARYADGCPRCEASPCACP